MQSPERMVALILEAGSDCGTSAVKSLMKAYTPEEQPELVFVDADIDNSPAVVYRTKYRVPMASDEDAYYEAILRIIEKHNIQLVLPTSDYDAKVLVKHRKELYEKGVILALSALDTYELWEDKLAFALAQPHIHPRTDNTMHHMDFPVFAKPRYGVGSRGVRVIHSNIEAEAINEGNEPYVFQDILRGKQCTVDVLCDYTGEPLQAVTREVRRLKGGSDVVCKVVDAPKLEHLAMTLCATYNVVGAACFEFMFDEDGEPKLIDAQPRLSGAHIITTMAGLNIPHWLIQLAQGKRFKPATINYGMTIIRQFEELEVYE